MSPLKKIFTLKNSESKILEKPTEDEQKKVKLTFFESGYGSSKQAEGNDKVFRACLEEVYIVFNSMVIGE